MGVLRIPRPIATYGPNSPTRTLTTDMISPPLPPDFNFDSETVTPSILPALEFISCKLQQKSMHVTLLVGRGKPFPTGQASDLMVIPATPLELQSWRTLYNAVAKGAKKFSLGQSWTDALARSQHERHANEYLIQQSILQNEVAFSQEGLTLLKMDRIYTFKRRLCILSHGRNTFLEDSDIDSCVDLLHRTILDFQGRTFSKAFFHRVYEQLDVKDELLMKVANAYQSKYQQDGIVLSKPEQRARKLPVRVVRVRRQLPPPTRRGAMTPQSASDFTPITRNEWNILIGPGFGRTEVKPAVTRWTPSPAVLGVA